MLDSFVVLGLESDKKFSPISKEWESALSLFYFAYEPSNTSIFRGFNVVKSDILGFFDSDDFCEFPGVYALEYSISGNRPIFSGCTFSESFKIDSDISDFYVLSARLGEFETEEGTKKKGVNIRYLDLSSFQETSDRRGYIPNSGWCDKSSMSQFPKVPGHYRLDPRMVRDRKGDAIIKIANPSYVSLNNYEVA